MSRVPTTARRGMRKPGALFSKNWVVAKSGTIVVVWYSIDADQELSIVVDFGWKVVDNDIFPMFWSGSAIGVNDELRES